MRPVLFSAASRADPFKVVRITDSRASGSAEIRLSSQFVANSSTPAPTTVATSPSLSSRSSIPEMPPPPH